MKTWKLLAILILALVLRLSLWVAASLNPAGVFTPDSGDYWLAGQNLLHTGQFTTGEDPEIFRTPGYPAFLALPQSAWPDAEHDGRTAWRVALVMQVMLDVLLVLVVYWLGTLVADPATAVLAALLQAISAAAIAYSCRILSDSLYSFLFTLALLMMAGHLRTNLRWPLGLAAVVLAAATYVRPVGIAMALVFAVVLLARRGRLRNLAVFAGLFAACLAPWVVRNAATADYAGFSSFAGDTAYNFYAPEVLARVDRVGGNTARVALEAEDDAYVDRVHPTPGEAARRRAARAREIILAHPWLYARIHLAGSGGVFLPAATDVLEVAGVTTGNRNTLEVLRTRGVWAAAEHYFGGWGSAMALAIPMVAILAIKYAGLLLCGIRRLRRGLPATAWLMILVVIVSVLLTGPFGLPRYRVPLEPILNLGAAMGLIIGWGFLKRRVSRVK